MCREMSGVSRERELTARQVLSWFDNWSLLFGYSIFAHQRSKYILYWNRFRAIIGIILGLTLVFDAARSAITSKKILYSISNTSFFSTQIIYFSLIQIYGKTIATYFDDCFDAMSVDHQKRIRKISQMLTYFVLLTELIMNSMYLVTIIRVTPESVTERIFNVFLLITEDHLVNMFFLELILILSCYYSCVNTINKMRRQWLTSRKINQLSLTLMISASKLENFVSRLNSINGIPLVILLIQTFISTAGVVSLLLQSETQLRFWALTECFSLIYYIFILIMLVIVAVCVKTKLDTKRKTIIDGVICQQLTNINLTADLQIGLQKMSNVGLFDFSVMSILPLDMSLILSFSSAMITFTILFLQLEASQ